MNNRTFISGYIKTIMSTDNFTDNLDSKVVNEFEKLKLNIESVREKYSSKEDLGRSPRDCIWVLFSYNIFVQIESVLFLITHPESPRKDRRVPFVILRSICEDYFRFKLISEQKDDRSLQKHIQALLRLDSHNNKKTLEKSGMDTDLPDLLTKFKSDLNQFSDKEIEELAKIYERVEEVCKKFDSDFLPEENKLLNTYNIVYRFASGAAHSSLTFMEKTLDTLWEDDSNNWEAIYVVLYEVLIELNKKAEVV